jgi:hypothetical protein
MTTNNTVGIEYGGEALEPTTSYFWQVITSTN